MKSSDLVNKLQFVERFGKTAAVTWCLLCDVSFGLNLTLPECKWCLLVPDNFLNPLHTTAVKKRNHSGCFCLTLTPSYSSPCVHYFNLLMHQCR